MAQPKRPDIRVEMDHSDGTRDEGDRVTVHANGIIIDVIANSDGSVYVETYAYESSTKQAVVQHAAIDRYTERHPNLRLDLVDRP